MCNASVRLCDPTAFNFWAFSLVKIANPISVGARAGRRSDKGVVSNGLRSDDRGARIAQVSHPSAERTAQKTPGGITESPAERP